MLFLLRINVRFQLYFNNIIAKISSSLTFMKIRLLNILKLSFLITKQKLKQSNKNRTVIEGD